MYRPRVEEAKDEWIIKGNKVICQHRRPRKELAFPTSGGCPVDWDKLKPRRFTHAIMINSGVIHEHEDA
eukprot:2974391-Pyramimonas_sp.AAC.1